MENIPYRECIEHTCSDKFFAGVRKCLLNVSERSLFFSLDVPIKEQVQLSTKLQVAAGSSW